MLVFTARKRSLGQGNIFSSVCQEYSVHRGGLPQCMLGYHPPGADTPPTRHPPGPSTPPLGDTVNKRAVCILLECNLVYLCLQYLDFLDSYTSCKNDEAV